VPENGVKNVIKERKYNQKHNQQFHSTSTNHSTICRLQWFSDDIPDNMYKSWSMPTTGSLCMFGQLCQLNLRHSIGR